MTAPTARLGGQLKELDRQMVLAALDGERRVRNGDTADAALCYTRACALATALHHVWAGLGGEGDPEAGRYGGLQGHYALRANACADWPWKSAGPPPREAADPGWRLPPAPGSPAYLEADARWTAHLAERAAEVSGDVSDLIDRD
jgi:hypothetical protein